MNGEQQPMDPLQMLIGRHVAYIDKNKATRIGKLRKINRSGTCIVEQKITLVKQKNGRYYPPVRHQVERQCITGTARKGNSKIMPLEKVTKIIKNKADKTGVILNHDEFPMPEEQFSFTKIISKSEAFHGFLSIAKKADLDIGDKVDVRMNGWKISTHVQKVKRIWMRKEMQGIHVQEGDTLLFDVLKKAGMTIITAKKAEAD